MANQAAAPTRHERRRNESKAQKRQTVRTLSVGRRACILIHSPRHLLQHLLHRLLTIREERFLISGLPPFLEVRFRQIPVGPDLFRKLAQLQVELRN